MTALLPIKARRYRKKAIPMPPAATATNTAAVPDVISKEVITPTENETAQQPILRQIGAGIRGLQPHPCVIGPSSFCFRWCIICRNRMEGADFFNETFGTAWVHAPNPSDPSLHRTSDNNSHAGRMEFSHRGLLHKLRSLFPSDGYRR